MDPYFYTQLLGAIPAPFPGDAKTAGPPVIMSDRILMEHALKDRRIVAERADLEDGRRVFRVETRYLWLMQKDGTGYYVPFGKKKYYWTEANPISEAEFIREWVTL